MLKTIDEYAEYAQQIRDKLMNEAKELVKPMLEDFMITHPDLEAIGWTQYTPYFNDGEECTFSVHGLAASTSCERDEGSLYGEGWQDVYSYSIELPEGFSQSTWDDLNKLGRALSSIDTELQFIFGDHSMVVVTRDGVEVSEYEHD